MIGLNTAARAALKEAYQEREQGYLNGYLSKIRRDGVPTTQIGDREANFGSVSDSLIFKVESFDKANIYDWLIPTKDFELIACTSIIVNNTQSILKTKTFGLRGSFKEFITPDDLTIEVKGILTVPNEDRLKGETTPLNQVVLLEQYASAGIVLKIDCKYLQQGYAVNNVILQNYSINRKLPTAWEISISLISDYSYNLEDFIKT